MKYENEEQTRKDFARIFDWYNVKHEYGYSNQTKELRTPEWAEIFAEVGKMKNKINIDDIEMRFVSLEKMINNIEFPLNK